MSAAERLTRDQVCDWLQVKPRELSNLMAHGHFPRATMFDGEPGWDLLTLDRWLDDARTPRPTAPVRTALYRHFDAVGALLYVGISLCAIRRLASHRATAEWFDRIAEVKIEWFDTRAAALEAEAVAIATEHPAHNIAGRKA